MSRCPVLAGASGTQNVGSPRKACMRILLINYEFPPLGGGAANATRQLAAEMARRGHAVTVLTSAHGRLPRRETVNGFTVKRIATLRRRPDRCNVPEMATFLASSVAGALREGVTNRPDVACAFFGLPCGPAALALNKVFGVPYLVSLRGGDVPGFQPYDLAFYHRLTGPLIASIWRRAAAVVANSRGLKALAHAAAPDVDFELIPNGVRLPRLAAPAELPPPSIAFTGRLVEQKGLTYLLEALPGIARSVPNVSLTLMGDGPLRGQLEQRAAELGVAARLSITGWIDREEVVRRLSGAGLFVLPSLDEGMSNALLEAMACGLPAIATNISGNEELIEPGRNGWLIPTRDTAAIEHASVSILTDDAARTSMGAASRSMAECRDWTRAAAAYLTLFERARRTPSASAARLSTPLEDAT